MRVKPEVQSANEQIDYSEALLARLKAEENFLLFPVEFDKLDGDILSMKEFFKTVEAFRERIKNYKTEHPHTNVNPDTLRETLNTFDRALKTGESLCMQLGKIRGVLHEEAKIRNRRNKRRSK